MKNILIVFLILIYSNLMSCQIYTRDVTINSKQSFQYDTYDNICNFKYSILVGDPINNYNYVIQSNSNEYSPNTTINAIFGFGSKKTLFEIEIKAYAGAYNHSFTAKRLLELTSTKNILTATNDDETEFFLIYECSTLPENIDIVNLSPRGSELDVFGKVSAYFKYINAKTTFELSQYNCYPCYQTTLKNNNNKIVLEIWSEITFGNADAEFIFNLNEKESRSYKPSSYYDLNVYDEIKNVKQYPDTEFFQRDSRNYGPVFTFDSNNTHYTLPLYVQTAGIGGYTSDDFYYRAISSKNGIIKYIGNIDLNLDTSSNSIYAQNRSNNHYFFSTSIGVNDDSYDSIFKGNFDQYDDYFEVSNQYFGAFLARRQVEYFNVIETTFPFGISIDNGIMVYKFTFLVEPVAVISEREFSVRPFANDNGYGSGFSYYISPKIQTYSPYFDNIEFIHLFDHNYILRIRVLSEFIINKIKIDGKYYYAERLVDSSSSEFDNYNSTLDFHVNLFNPIQEIIVLDGEALLENDYYDLENLKYFSNPKFNDDEFDIFNVSFSKILYSEMDVTNQTVGNILYFNYTNINYDTAISLVLFDPLNNFRPLNDFNQYPTDNLWPARWNSSLSLFQVEFYIKANSIPGQIPYALFIDRDNYVPSNVLSDSSQFTVISNNIDQFGPIFENIDIYPTREASFARLSLNSILQKNGLIELEEEDVSRYLFNIIDEYNGFKEGYITFQGDYDGSIYNFTFTPNDAVLGDKYNGTYVLELYTNTKNCIYQNYLVIEVKLFDQQGYNSTFTRYALDGGYSQANSLSNPFMNYINETNHYSVPSMCLNATNDETEPQLLKFELINGPNNTHPIDVGSNDRYLEFIVVANDDDRGLLKGQSPTIYITTTNINIFECKSYSTEIMDEFTSQFNYKCQLPIGFGYPYGFIFQLFTITSNGGYAKSFSTQELRELGFRHNVDNSSISMSLNYPSITGTNKIKSSDNEFWIYGRGFQDVNQVSLVLPDNSKVVVDIVQNLKSALKLKNLPKGVIKCFTEFKYQSNKIYRDPFEIIITKGVENALEGLPINPDQECQGKPLCGGEKNGHCSSTGCVCYPPWIGKDCLSKVIDLPKDFEINKNEPTSDFSRVENGITYKSLVSIVSLREIDIFGKIVSENKFNSSSWQYSKLSNSTHQYKTNILNSIINVKLTSFEQDQNITFASQQLLMYENSIKYTIDIDKYPFKSKLNSLELIMSASLESSKINDICSSLEFGNTTNGVDNSNYMKIQVENQSLYARFIKRGIYDYITIRKISNTLLESEKQNKEYSSNTLIAIQMAYFSDHIQIDPDFSVLLNSNSASKDSENSICSKNKNSGLGGAKIAGIVIGSIAFVAVIVTSVIYHFYRKKQQKKFVSNIQLKLNEMNK